MWTGLEVALIGGDRREAEMAIMARDAGAEVRTYGVPLLKEEADIRICETVEQAIEGARVAIMPIPLVAADGTLYAPHAPSPILVGREHLATMSARAHIVTGRADENLRAAASAARVTIHEYESDTDLMLLRAPAVAEGAIRVAIERSPVTIHGSDIAVIGFGRIASVLAGTLIALRARVHVVARRAEARAAAYAIGAEPHPFEDIPALFPGVSILFNSVPAPVIGKTELGNLPAHALVVDLAAPPGGVDLPSASALGLESVWARGLGASAPLTVARSQWTGVDRIVALALED